MGQPISSSTSAASTNAAPLPSSNLGGSIDQDYLELLAEFNIPNLLNAPSNLSDKEVVDLTPSASEVTNPSLAQEAEKTSSLIHKPEESKTSQSQPSSETIFWNPSLKELQTEDRIHTIHNRIASFKNSATIAHTNIKSFIPQATSKLSQNDAFIKKVNGWMGNVIKMGGGNFSLVQTYKVTLANMTPFSKTLPQTNDTIDILKRVFAKIEAKADEISADFIKSVKKFESSVITNTVDSDFSNVSSSLSSLISLVSNPATHVIPHIQSFNNLISQSKTRIAELRQYLNGPVNPHLYLKDRSEFIAEIDILEQNVQFLESYLPKLQSTENARVSLLNQLKDLQRFISDLNQAHLKFVIEEFQDKKAPIENLTFNGKNLQELLP